MVLLLLSVGGPDHDHLKKMKSRAYDFIQDRLFVFAWFMVL